MPTISSNKRADPKLSTSPKRAWRPVLIRFLCGLAIWMGIFGCGHRSAETPTVVGYNEMGSRETRKSAFGGSVCPVVGSFFAARCEDSGLKILLADDCSLLCSGPVDP